MLFYARVYGRKGPLSDSAHGTGSNLERKEEKARKNDKFFVSIQKITTFACLFGEKP